MADVLAALTRAVDEILSVDAATLTDPELHKLALTLLRQRERLAAGCAEVFAQWDARKLWAADGSKAGWARLGRECSLRPDTAKREIRRARKLGCMPVVAAEVKTGGLSLDQAELLGCANTPDFAELYQRDEEMLISPHPVDAAPRRRPDDRILAPSRGRRHREDARVLQTPAAPRDCVPAPRRLGRRESVVGPDRRHRVPHRTRASRTRAVRVRLRGVDRVWPRRPPDPRSHPAQRRADALVEMARRSASMPAGARPPRPLVNILCGIPKFARICELADGTVIPPGSIVPHLADADIERIVFGSPSRVLDVGVRERFFTGALRRAIEVRDRHCQHPAGCDIPAEQCHIDHIIPWAEGGETTQDNGRCYCPVHNRQRTKRPPPERSP